MSAHSNQHKQGIRKIRSDSGTFIVRTLTEDARPFGWDEVFYVPVQGYWLAGPFGAIKHLTRDEGRAVMRGHVCVVSTYSDYPDNCY